MRNEKFGQFNRNDSRRHIPNGLKDLRDEIVDETKELSTSNNRPLSPSAPEVRKGPKETQLTLEEIEIFSVLKKPKDILSLPKDLREKGLLHFKEKIVKRYLAIQKIQQVLFGHIESEHSNGTLNIESLQSYVDSQAEKLNLNTGDKIILHSALVEFKVLYKKLLPFTHYAPNELLEKFSTAESTYQTFGKCEISVTPFSVNFDFTSLEDFRKFVSRNSEEEHAHYKNTVGLSYSRNGVPVTASGGDSKKSTYRHEQQHKKFSIANVDSNDYRDAKNRTKDELLAFLAGGREESDRLLSNVRAYRFWEKYNVEESRYKKLLSSSVNAIKELLQSNFSREEVINTLAKEDLQNWPKVSARLVESFAKEYVPAVEVHLKNQLLSRFESDINAPALFKLVHDYSKWKDSPVSEMKYDKLLRGATDTIIYLDKKRWPKDQIVELLSNEPLNKWPRVLARVKESGTKKWFGPSKSKRRVHLGY